jgi:hypothetical protein
MDEKIGKEALIPNKRLELFKPLIGTWATVGHHPMVPGKTFHGRTSFEWHEGGAFVLVRSEINEPEIPSGVVIFGSDNDEDTLWMIYFDERPMSRHYEASIEQNVLKWWRNTPKFSQRNTLTVADDARTLHGVGEMSKDGAPWGPDLQLDYTRID